MEVHVYIFININIYIYILFLLFINNARIAVEDILTKQTCNELFWILVFYAVQPKHFWGSTQNVLPYKYFVYFIKARYEKKTRHPLSSNSHPSATANRGGGGGG